MPVRPRAFAILVLPLLLAAGPARPVRLDNGLARTPPMGWNTWNKFACNVSDQLLRETADAMVATGMKAAGYEFLVIDDCWQVARDSQGAIVPDPQRFPNGMKALADYVHAQGLKFGIYTDAGTQTCEGRPGSLGHEEQDARTYASWGVDYIKVDWCHHEGLDPRVQYQKMRDALAHAGRPIVFSICEWGSNRPWEWAPPVGNLWRTTGDISDSWPSMIHIVDQSGQHAAVAGPGGWNDPDMLEIGNGGMTDDEYRAHLSLWAVMAAPLIAGNDLRTMAPEIRAILTNTEVLAVDQDSLGTQGAKVAEPSHGLEVWSKPLRDGARAVVLLNRTGRAATITTDWTSTGLHGRQPIRDLWAHADRPPAERVSARVAAHAVVMLRVGGARRR
jgi:alpha-galactosidase